MGFGQLQIFEDLLDDQLGAPVGVGGAAGEILADRQAGGIAVDGGRGAEHQIVHPGPFHRLQQGEGAAEVVLVVIQWNAGRLADRLEGGKVDHRIDLLFGEDPVQQSPIANIPLIEQGLLAVDGGDSGQHAALAVAEVVDHHGIHACRLQGQTGVAADISATAGDQNVHLALH